MLVARLWRYFCFVSADFVTGLNAVVSSSFLVGATGFSAAFVCIDNCLHAVSSLGCCAGQGLRHSAEERARVLEGLAVTGCSQRPRSLSHPPGLGW